MDKRTVRTRNAIKNSLVKILNEKRLDTITITEVCVRSNIQRSTFYSHYQNVNECFQEIIDDVILAMKKEIEMNQVKDILGFYRTYFDVALRNKDIFRAVHNTSINNPLIQSLIEISNDIFGESDSYLNKLLMNYHLAGFYAFSKAWLDNDCKESVDELLTMLENIHYGNL